MNYGWWSVVPPVVAICLAIVTRRVVASLLFGIVVGVLILTDWSGDAPMLAAVADLCEARLWPNLCDQGHLRVFVFTSLMGAMIGVIHRSGGMQGVVNSLAPLARTRRGGQLLTWFLGLLIFIDDYANSLLLGNTMRPLTDKLHISREKLAYLVDSTAAPVAGLALISTWVAGEIGYIDEGFSSVTLPAGVAADAFTVFLATIPYRFYVLLALVFVPLVGFFGRDFGPMLAAERKVFRHGPPSSRRDAASDGTAEGAPRHWLNAVLPILVTLAVAIGLLLLTGHRKVGGELAETGMWRKLAQVFGAGDSYLSLVYGSLAGLLAAIFLSRLQGILSLVEARAAAFRGATLVLPALVILWLAWTLSGITDQENLGTGQFLGQQLQAAVDVRWMPTLVFILSSFVAFSTGTSWGTMGILMPIVVSTTYSMMSQQLDLVDPYAPIMTASIAGVLAGAIFGDHCSPISDTTVLSSQASGCDHVAHVWTQLPYALLVATVSIVFGTLPVGFGVPVWALLAMAVVALIVLLRVLGRRADEVTEPSGGGEHL
jgi:Na+/H+ antiporter NhaC